MLNNLIDFSLKNRLLVLLILGITIIFSFWNLLSLPIDAFPDTTPVQIQINTVAPALSPEEIEQQITLPVELSIGGLPGLMSVRSISKFGLSQVVAIFSDNTNITDARQYVSERLSSVQLSEGIALPQLGPLATGIGEVFHYTLRSKSPNRTLEELRTMHDWLIKPQLRKVPGVAEINSWGGYEKQFHVVLSPSSLFKYNLNIEDVFKALKQNNYNVGGGMITSSGQSELIRGVGRVSTIEEIENIVIKSYNGTPIRIVDVSKEIKIGYEIRRGAVSAQGKGEAVLGLAFMLMGENGKVVTEALKKQLNNASKSLPDDVIVQVVYDRTELTAEVINTVKHNLIAGAILVILVLLILLGNLRAGLLVACVIPIAMLFASFGMTNFAIAASLLSLGAIDFGIIVDGSVVMTEANLRNLQEQSQILGRDLTPTERLDVLIESCKQMVRPIVFGMGIIMVVFIPILTLEGVEGKMFHPMAWTFIFAIASALLIALVITPVLNYYFLPHKAQKKEGILSKYLSIVYGWLFTLAMKIRGLVFILVFLLLGLTVWLANNLGGEFIPRLNEGAIVINTIRLAGISMEESVRYNTQIEKLLLKEYPDEIRFIWSRIGTAEVATDPMGTELTDVFISLKPRSEWKKVSSQNELVTKMQETVSDLPGLNMVFTQPIEMRLNEMDSGIRSDVGIKVYGDDFEELIRISDEVQRVLTQIKGQSDIAVDQITGQPTFLIKINQKAIARYGIPARHILDLIECIGGKKVGDIFEEQKKFPLVVRLPDSYRSNKNTLSEMLISTNFGKKIPLSELVDISKIEGAATINREWGRRLIRVQCNVSGRDVSSFIDEVKQKIHDSIDLPEGYMIDWGGQFKNLERAKIRLVIVVPITLLIVFLLLYFSLQNMRDVLLIYTGIPFALIGGVFSLWIRDIPFSVSAAVGFIALSGIAVLNGQILVSAIQVFLNQGKDLYQAVMLASHQRLRPVLATAITDAVGFIPMAISTGVGAEVQRPLATVVIGGVITSTLLTLLVLPLLYLLFGKKK
ncbi:MAG: efflux RND transporter permease subunit [Flavobacteriaceae bacterium]|nr:efflux RND transporter permease subunit [Flavobacteriaceae bacterium]